MLVGVAVPVREEQVAWSGTEALEARIDGVGDGGAMRYFTNSKAARGAKIEYDQHGPA